MTPLLIAAALLSSDLPKDWSRWTRMCGNGIDRGAISAVVLRAIDSGVYGIEVDNDPTGRYESFLDPTAKLKDLKAAAVAAHQVHNPVFAYLAGTECITANAANTAHSVLKDHPDWVQQDRDGRKAVFKSGDAFWIAKGDEDVWITPFAPAWRKQFMSIVRGMVATGIDGVYIDVPYWMTHFEGWDKTWASFDPYTVAAFKAKTGLDALAQVKLGDYRDPGFRKWVAFRIQAITDFMAEINRNVKSVNPRCLTIPEIYPGFDNDASIVGADVYELAKVCDVVCHEYNPGERSSLRTTKDWMQYVQGLESFRGFAEGKPTWMLTYSWSGEKLPTPQDAMDNLACVNVMEGTNMWDASRMVMDGSNDISERKNIYTWIKANEQLLYSPRTPIDPTGVYFSPASRNFRPEAFTKSYTDTLSALLQDHQEVQIVTPRTLNYFRGKKLFLPGVSCLSQVELIRLSQLTGNSVKNVVKGQAEILNEDGSPAHSRPQLSWTSDYARKPNTVKVNAPATVFANIASVQGHPTVFLSNVTGLGPGKDGQPTACEVLLSFPTGFKGQVFEVPFLGAEQKVKSAVIDGRVHCKLELKRGSIIQLR
jgi:hypothetical protein